ncbi:Uma2 family endonuclease [Nonomuraea thailandensis]
MGEGATPDTEWVTAMATIEPSRTRTFLPSGRPFTIDDLLAIPDDGNRYELFNGSLLVSPAPSRVHQRVVYRLQRLLDDALPPDLEPVATINMRVSEKDYYIPDLVVLPMDLPDSDGLMHSPKDMLLAVEVGSPSTKMRDEDIKVKAYAQAGVPFYSRVEPDEGPTLYVYELNGDRYKPPTMYKAGTMTELSEPFPMSFDLTQLVE